MTLKIYAHPLSSYCQKVLIALYENGTAFDYRELGPDTPDHAREFATLWPIQHMPLLVDGARSVAETSVIIEYLDQYHPGAAPLIPTDIDAALEARFMDRCFDNYVMTPVQTVVFERRRPEGNADPYGVGKAREMLARAYGWLDTVMATREWAAGDAFSLADCAAAPSLLYAKYALPFDGFPNVTAYHERLEARPSVARTREEGKPFWDWFPLANG
ncbi:glutathione S-transferase family protein [Sphingomonas sp. ERG5]|uniref:glutathione S-transferase family protein n=1 Tax=Sphingomonas sp. ERG5 TaxID=1381597 RepID=UPI00054BF629|nr:glutathione S-transferase family protein [Sphingomonas sp. ERG5]